MPDQTPANGIPLQIGGRDRVLRFNYASLCALEQAVGPEQAIRDITGSTPELCRPRDLLFAGLKHEDPGLTLDKSAALIDEYLTNGGRIADLSKKLSDAIGGSPFLRSLSREGRRIKEEERQAAPSETSAPIAPSESASPIGASA